MATRKPVLVVGATGDLGSKVVARLLANGHAVRALVRSLPATAAASASPPKEVELVVGDVLTPASLAPAFAGGVLAVVVAAAHFGTGGRGRASTNASDLAGGRNLVDAAKQAGAPRVVLLSNLQADHPGAANVAHFATKRALEAYLAEVGVPFVAVRAGAFLSTGNFRDLVSKRHVGVLWGTEVKFSLVPISTVARVLADAAVLPLPSSNDRRVVVDLGTDRAVTATELAQLFSTAVGGVVTVGRAPPLLITIIGWFSSFMYDIKVMGEFIDTGAFVANTATQAALFGPVPTVEEAVRDFVAEHKMMSTV